MKNPPKFDSNSSYETWKRDVKLWTKLTSLEKNKQGIAVYLSLTGQAKDLASEVPEADLEKDGGVDAVIAKLDDLFLADKGLRQFAAFHKLYNMKRAVEENVGTFISDFEHAYFKFKQYEMELPDRVRGYILLSSCNLSQNERKLVLSGIDDVTYDNMKDSLKRIFATELSGRKQPVDDIKSEQIFHSNNFEDNEEVFYANKSRGGFGRGRRGSNRGSRYASGSFRGGNNNRTFGNNCSGANAVKPNSKVDKVQRCYACGSKFHYIKDCPDKDKNQLNYSDGDSEVVHLSLFNSNEPSKKLQSLVAESLGFAVLDTGCSSTVCGMEWFDNYISNLSNYDQSKIEEYPSVSSFTFGDGTVVKSEKKVVIPCYIGGIRSTITTDIVECNIPLLLSKQSMKKANMQLHFGNDTVHIGKNVNKLKCSTSGHYLLPIGF